MNKIILKLAGLAWLEVLLLGIGAFFGNLVLLGDVSTINKPPADDNSISIVDSHFCFFFFTRLFRIFLFLNNFLNSSVTLKAVCKDGLRMAPKLFWNQFLTDFALVSNERSQSDSKSGGGKLHSSVVAQFFFLPFLLFKFSVSFTRKSYSSPILRFHLPLRLKVGTSEIKNISWNTKW